MIGSTIISPTYRLRCSYWPPTMTLSISSLSRYGLTSPMRLVDDDRDQDDEDLEPVGPEERRRSGGRSGRGAPAGRARSRWRGASGDRHRSHRGRAGGRRHRGRSSRQPGCWDGGYQAVAVWCSAMPSDSSQRSASIAAVRRRPPRSRPGGSGGRATSPAMNTPAIRLRCGRGRRGSPSASTSSQSRNTSVFGLWPIAMNRPSIGQLALVAGLGVADLERPRPSRRPGPRLDRRVGVDVDLGVARTIRSIMIFEARNAVAPVEQVDLASRTW